MTRFERYRKQIEVLEAKRNLLLRNGRYIEASNLNNDILEVKKAIKQAEDYEELTKPKPIRDLLTKEELDEMGLIPLMIEAHLVADFLTEVCYMIVDVCNDHGLNDVSFMPDLKDILKRADKFASFLTTLDPDLTDMLVRNDTFNASLHKKYLKYIEQRSKKPCNSCN